MSANCCEFHVGTEKKKRCRDKHKKNRDMLLHDFWYAKKMPDASRALFNPHTVLLDEDEIGSILLCLSFYYSFFIHSVSLYCSVLSSLKSLFFFFVFRFSSCANFLHQIRVLSLLLIFPIISSGKCNFQFFCLEIHDACLFAYGHRPLANAKTNILLLNFVPCLLVKTPPPPWRYTGRVLYVHIQQ